MGLNTPGSRVWISDSHNPKRKLRYTLEILEAETPSGPELVGINTMHPNKLALEALQQGVIEPLSGFSQYQTEVKYGENSRIDILLDYADAPQCYVEVKNVHLLRQAGLHEFPDCKTARGAKHLRELGQMVRSGHRACMLYMIQRWDGEQFSLARDLDADYAKAFDDALSVGVEAYAVRCQISPSEIIPAQQIEIV